MTDLISRADTIRALRQIHQQDVHLTYPELISFLERAPTITPQVVANITGGLMQGASANYPVDIYTLDFDDEGAEPEDLIEIDGDEAYLGQTSALVDPDFVRRVVEGTDND